MYVKVNNGSFAQVNVDVTGNWSTNLTVGYGFYTNFVYAVDYAGNVSPTNSVIVEYKASPSVSITTPVNNSQTNISAITVSGTATIVSPYVVQSVEVSVNGGAFAVATLSLPNWSMSGVSLVEGTNTIVAKATADNGKVSYVTNRVVKFRKWTIMIFMNGDNDLEPFAIQDFNEIEAVPELVNEDVNVIVLFDRANGYDTSNGDWKGTRLYRVVYDPNGLDGTIVSSPSINSPFILTPNEADPRYFFQSWSLYLITSPGVSFVPASILPSITISAPAASAFATSPGLFIPPSAIKEIFNFISSR